jgi:hypothetical protein
MNITKKSWKIISLVMVFILTLDFIFFISGLYHFRVFNTVNYYKQDLILEFSMYMAKLGFLILLFKPQQKNKNLSLVLLGFLILIELYLHISNILYFDLTYLYDSRGLPFLTISFYIFLYISAILNKMQNKAFKRIIIISVLVIFFLILLLSIITFFDFIGLSIFLSVFNSLVYGLFIIYIGLSFTLPKEAIYQPDEILQKLNGQNYDLLYSKGYQSIAKNIILSIITLGVYFYIWIYRINVKMKELSDDQTNAGTSLVLYMFIPFYSIYWAYKKGQQLNEYYLTYNKKTSDYAVVYLLLAIFGLGIIAIALMQSEINTIVIQDSYKTKKYEELHNPLLKDDYGLKDLNKEFVVKDDVALLKELAELNKSGVLSDEEFQEKKREIIKRM